MWQFYRDITLTLMRRQIDDHQIKRRVCPRPLRQHKVLSGRILFPCPAGNEKLTGSASDSAATECDQQFPVNLLHIGVGILASPTHQLHRQSPFVARKLALVQKAHAREAEDDQGCRALLLRSQERSDPPFIMIFQEMRTGAQPVWAERRQVALHCASISGDQLIIKSLVVSIIKSERLQPMLDSPVDLGQKLKPGMGLFQSLHSLGPEFVARRRLRAR